MMKLGYPEKIGVLAAGAVLSVLGMMDFTGITQWGTSPYLLYIGYAVAIAGLALVFMDLRSSGETLQAYDDVMALSEAPDDDYCVCLDGSAEYVDDTELCDLTAGPQDTVEGTVPEEA